MDKKRIKVRKSDSFRCLVTETQPAETPIIFSNDGFYLRCVKNASTADSLVEQVFNLLVKQKGEGNWFVPYSYKIKKNSLSYRTLSVIHPAAQWKVAEFYAENASLIVHYTTRSEFSLRAPKAVAGYYYVRTGINDLSKFKRSHVALAGADQYLSHSPSYFAYSGFGRLYKFFDSKEFVDLEERFEHLWLLDVSKCFDSIYTHTILWAVKDKEFAKEHFSFRSFGSSFDKLMQVANHGETSGIVIGPEVSRIFAEIILQEVDDRVRRTLLNDRKLREGVDYAIRRYVDDYFVFAREVHVSLLVRATIESQLLEFKLGINEAKIQCFMRPFLTGKSRSILDANKVLRSFAEKFTALPSVEDKLVERVLVPLEIYKLDRLFISFCNDIKICCDSNNCGYDEVSGYLISALKNRAALLMKNESLSREVGLSKKMFDALVLILRSMFFLYGVAPSVTASYRLSTSLIMIVRYGDTHLKSYSQSLNSFVFSQVSDVIEASVSGSRTEGFVDLETQNLLLAVSELGEDLRISPVLLDKMFIREGRRSSYFNLATAIYYVKDGPGYATLRKWVCDGVDSLLKNIKDVKTNSEVAAVALDFIGCPHIDRSRRQAWARLLLEGLGLPTSDPVAIDMLIKDFEELPWFIDWKEVDLLNLLERKELHAVY